MPQETGLASTLVRCGMVCALVGCGTLIAFAALRLGIHAPFLSFVPSIALCCLYDGFAMAAFATLLSGMSLWYFFIPPKGFGLPSAGDTGHVLLYLGVCLVMCLIIRYQRRFNDALAQENFELGYKVFLLRRLRSAVEAGSDR